MGSIFDSIRSSFKIKICDHLPESASQGDILYNATDGYCYYYIDGSFVKMDFGNGEPVKIHKHTKCPSCGAPVNIHMDHCEFCGTPYEYTFEEPQLYSKNIL
ncbi:MAG: hypothetical protein IKR19_08880 [Acholeplasmatales bacterium]|nr:hypothetical protein [Acholeplasmatales bacterium]